MNEFDLGYIVGIFEGEGFIAFNYGFRKDKYQREYYTVHIGVVNTDLNLLEKFKSIIGYGNITKKADVPNCKSCWNWRVSNQKEALDFLDKVFPYLIVKKEKAKLIIEFLKLRISCNPNAKANCQRQYTEYERGFYNKYRNLGSFSPSKKEV
jgi:hypothetical protein